MKRLVRQFRPFVLVLLLIEYLDELVFGIREAAWPLIRDDLGLTYTQVGLLLSVPGLISSFIEPFIGILGDVWQRRRLVLYGGVAFTLSLALTAVSGRFEPLLLSFILFYPASGAFVSLSQASLMDTDPGRHEQNMARWVFAGSLGVVSGPLALGAVVWLGIGWRGGYALTAAAALLLVFFARRFSFGSGLAHSGEAPAAGLPAAIRPALAAGFRQAFGALRRKAVLRWLVLLEFSDMMLDILLGFLALYLVDVVGVTPAQAGIGVGVWLAVGLVGDFLLIPLLERVRGLDYLRVSVLVELALFPVFLLVPAYWLKLVLLGVLGLFNAGWYSILKGNLYSELPGQSGTVMALNNISGLFGSLVPLGIGALAERFGLGAAMWSLLLGPIALLVGIAGTIGKSGSGTGENYAA